METIRDVTGSMPKSLRYILKIVMQWNLDIGASTRT